MINITLGHSELLLIIGAKEAQIYQQALKIDEINNQLEVLKNTSSLYEHKCSELLKDRDMDQIELANVRSKIAQMIMMAEKSNG